MATRTEIGIIGENTASKFLINKNYRIIHRNLHIGNFGEIDIVAEKYDGFWPFYKKTVVFVEVKAMISGGNNDFNPEIHINKEKSNRLIKLATIFLLKNGHELDTFWQIDVIAVEIEEISLEIKEIRHHENAIHL